jgi:hypothetical protein
VERTFQRALSVEKSERLVKALHSYLYTTDGPIHDGLLSSRAVSSSTSRRALELSPLPRVLHFLHSLRDSFLVGPCLHEHDVTMSGNARASAKILANVYTQM